MPYTLDDLLAMAYSDQGQEWQENKQDYSLTDLMGQAGLADQPEHQQTFQDLQDISGGGAYAPSYQQPLPPSNAGENTLQSLLDQFGGGAPAAQPARQPVKISVEKTGGGGDPIRSMIYRTAQKVGIDPDLFTALVKQESGFNPNAKSPAGAMGLTQLMPGTARSLGIKNPMDPQQNLMGGARYFKQQLKTFNGDIDKALAAYNAGPGNVRKYGGIPPFKETQGYVQKIKGTYQQLKGSYSQPQPKAAQPFDRQGASQIKGIERIGHKTAAGIGLPQHQYLNALDVKKFHPNECGLYAREVLKTYGWEGRTTSDLDNPKYGKKEKFTGVQNLAPGQVLHLKPSGKGTTVHWAVVAERGGELVLNELITSKGKARVSTNRTVDSVAGRIDRVYTPKTIGGKGHSVIPVTNRVTPQRNTEREILRGTGQRAGVGTAGSMVRDLWNRGKQIFAGTNQAVYRDVGRARKAAAPAGKWAGDIEHRVAATAEGIIPPASGAQGTPEQRVFGQGSPLNTLMAMTGGPSGPGNVVSRFLGARKAAKVAQTALPGMAELTPQAAVVNRTAEKIANVTGIPRELMTTADVSAIGRQMFKLGVRHPKQWGKAIVQTFKAFKSPENYKNLMDSIYKNPAYDMAKKSGLDLTVVGKVAEQWKKEEPYVSNILYGIPGLGKVVGASERAYSGGLNALRFGVWEDYYKTFGNSKGMKAYQELSKSINVLTGRGNMAGFENSALALSSTFFAPRWFVSKIQAPLLLRNSTPEVRKMAAQTLVAYTGTVLGTVGLLSRIPGVTVDWDPRSSDFLKVRIGNTRFDFSTGDAALVRYAAQTIMGERKNPETGKVSKVRRYEVLAGEHGLLRSKFAPPVGAAVDVLTGKNFVGEELAMNPGSIGRELENYLTPMVIQDIHEAVRESGWKMGVAAGAASAVGIGVQSYHRKPRTKAKKGSKTYGGAYGGTYGGPYSSTY